MRIFFQKYLRLRVLFLLAATVIFLNNLLVVSKLYRKIVRLNKTLDFYEPGREFVEFKKFLPGVEKIGFLTDKDTSPEHNDGMFLMAQYALAPIVLDLNNPHHRYLLLDYQNYLRAVADMEAIPAAPLVSNPFGKILAVKKP